MLNICQVSLAREIPIILQNYKNFKNIYENIKIFIVCPKKDKKRFKNKLKFKDFFIIDEDSIIKFSKFKKISNKYLKNKIFYKDIQNRLTWYYQQILKISFIIEFIEKKNSNITIWDADTIILKKIDFFNKNLSINYGNTSEYHRAYYATNKLILGTLPNYFISSLSQFISMTPKELKFLKKKLKKRKKIERKTGEWITHIVMKAVSKAHSQYNGSMFSEYELIGQSNLLNNFGKQRLVSGIREHLNGQLSDLQILISKFFGFKYIAYEHAHINKNSINMLNRKQTWLQFIKILTKKLSNNIYRGLRHQINFTFSLFKHIAR